MKMSSDLSNSLYERLQDYATNNDKDALAQSLSESFGIPPLRAAQMAELPFDRILEKLEHIITLMKRSIKEQCEAKRAHFQTEYQPVFDMLLPHMKAFLAKHADSEPSNFSALDIGSGYAIGTVTMALTLQAAFPKSKLLWYPSDWDGSYNDIMMAALSRKKHEKCSNIWFKSLKHFQSHFLLTRRNSQYSKEMRLSFVD